MKIKTQYIKRFATRSTRKFLRSLFTKITHINHAKHDELNMPLLYLFGKRKGRRGTY
jgi:hypothetical protein